MSSLNASTGFESGNIRGQHAGRMARIGWWALSAEAVIILSADLDFVVLYMQERLPIASKRIKRQTLP
eukprot:scaffold498079_cov20-Prasinocladus_malaysianus.AAC.1